VRTQPPNVEPTQTVEFLLHESLSDKSPTIVTRELIYQGRSWYLTPIPEVLTRNSDLPVKEIFWNFSCSENEKKRLSLKQNPHFYQVLPAGHMIYRTYPIKNIDYHKTISVLTDNLGLSGRVFLETRYRTRAFGNVWISNDTIIFKGSCFLYFFSTSDTLVRCLWKT
jgi:hypothetical protein